jgi:integrase
LGPLLLEAVLGCRGSKWPIRQYGLSSASNGKTDLVRVDSPRLQTKYNVPTLYLKDKRRGKFRLVWHEGSQKKYSADYIPTLEEAVRQKKLKQLYLANIAAGIKAEDPSTQGTRLTVANAIDMFLNELTGRGNTVDLYTHNLNQFQTWTTKTYVDQIDRAHILAFKKYLETSVGNEEYTAVWKCIRVNKMIKTLLKLAPGQGPVKKSDFSDVLNRKPLVTTYHKDERDKYLAACKGTEFIIWTLFLKCGLRLGEVSHLEWSDIDFVRHIIRVRKKSLQDGQNIVQFVPKKWSVRDIAIPADLMSLLTQHKAISKWNLCFPTRNGRINTKLWDQCKKIARRAGVDETKFMPKNFRSSYATNRLRNGYTLADIRDQMGHRDIHSVEHYLEAMLSEELVTSGRADAGWD